MLLDASQVFVGRIGGKLQSDVNVLSVVESMQPQSIHATERRQFFPPRRG